MILLPKNGTHKKISMSEKEVRNTEWFLNDFVEGLNVYTHIHMYHKRAHTVYMLKELLKKKRQKYISVLPSF